MFALFSIGCKKQQFILFQVIRGDGPLVMMSGDDVCQVLLKHIILCLFYLGIISLCSVPPKGDCQAAIQGHLNHPNF